jgi:hypothetical protein
MNKAWIQQAKQEQARERAKALRYKRAALSTLGWDTINTELQDIIDACEDIRWIEDSSDVTQEVLFGDEDEGRGYQMDFAQLAGDADRLQSALWAAYGEESEDGNTTFDDCTVALLGNRFDCIGFDSIELDYFSLTRFDSELAQTESAKRVMRMTKAEMLSTIGQNVGLLLAFYDLRQRFDYAQAALATATEHNLDTLRTVRAIEEAYEAWCESGCTQYSSASERLSQAANDLPDVFWIA